MNNYVLNEKKYIESIINDDFYTLENKPAHVLKMMAQYYYQFGGFRRMKITELLIDFLTKRFPAYNDNKTKWNDICDKIAKKTGGYDLLQCSGIPITGGEIQKLSVLFNKKLEKVAFVCLVLAKYNNIKNPDNNGWVNADTTTIFNMARVQGNEKARSLMIHKLVESGLLVATKKIDNTNLQVKFITDGDTVKTITDMRELGYQYLELAGYSDQFRKCVKCGILVKQFGDKPVKMCKTCYEDSKFRKARCKDCGTVFVCSRRAGIKTRCNECQSKINQQKKNEWQRNKKKSD